MSRLLIALALMFCTHLATAVEPQATPVLRSAVDLSISVTADAGVYEVKAVITDLADDAVIASPLLLVRDGEEGLISIDRADKGSLALSVLVQAAQGQLNYRSELRVGTQLVSRQSAQIALPR